ncbi:MAG: hypothetical protein ACK5H1_08575 [Tenacibaculum sp.]
MLDFLDSLYSSLKKRNKLQSISRLLIRNLSNILLPIYFKYSKSNKKNKKRVYLENTKVIVSITTFPQRISKIWLVIECVLRQTVLPDMIILWLSKEQFPNCFDDLPQRVLNYYVKGLLHIEFVEDDIRSHKKYYYALKEYPEDMIITLDDDLYYSSNTIKDLLLLNKNYPNALCCLRGFKVLRSKGAILPYVKWQKLTNEYGPAFDIFHTSGGGTLYKKSMFSNEVFNKEVFKKMSFYADDVWLNMMLQLNKTPTVKSEFYSHLIPIINNSVKLSRQNVTQGGNDKQIKALIDHYKIREDEVFN